MLKNKPFDTARAPSDLIAQMSVMELKLKISDPKSRQAYLELLERETKESVAIQDLRNTIDYIMIYLDAQNEAIISSLNELENKINKKADKKKSKK